MCQTIYYLKTTLWNLLFLKEDWFTVNQQKSQFYLFLEIKKPPRFIYSQNKTLTIASLFQLSVLFILIELYAFEFCKFPLASTRSEQVSAFCQNLSSKKNAKSCLRKLQGANSDRCSDKDFTKYTWCSIAPFFDLYSRIRNPLLKSVLCHL